MKHQETGTGRPHRLWLGSGTALATILLSGLASAQETRFYLRSGSSVCGTVLGEQGINTAVQTANGMQVILRRDQIARRQTEACDTPAAASALPAAASPVAIAPVAAPQVATPPAPNRVVAAAARSEEVQPGAFNLRFGGSTTMGERMVPDLVDIFLASNQLRTKGWAPGAAPNERIQEGRGEAGRTVRVLIATSGGQGAMPSLNEFRADIAMNVRPPNADEVAAYRTAYGLEANATPQEYVVALDGLAVIVHPDNKVRQLSLEQLRDIYAGAITNWSEVGGDNLGIRLVARESASAAWGLFNQVVMRQRPAARTVERPTSDTAIANAVTGEADAIGLVPFAYIGRNRALNLAASCGVEYEASEFGLKTEDYPLARRNYLYVSPRISEAGTEFLRFAASAGAYDTIRDAGYVSLQPILATRAHTTFRLLDATRAAPASPDARYAEAMLEYNLTTRNALRMSTTFRFTSGSHQLDGRGQEDLDRVAEFLRNPANARSRVSVLGFTDAAGAFGQNRAVSERRAAEVAQQLRQRGAQVASARGFGPIAPVACDDDPDAAIRNRRVEIWLVRG